MQLTLPHAIKFGMSSSSGCRSELSFPCKSLQTVVTHTSVSVFSDCSFSGIPGMRPACTTSSFRQGMDKEKGSCLSHSARSSPSSSSHFDFSSYSVANDEVGLNIHGWDSHDESVLYWMLCFYGSACRSDPPFQNEVKVAGTRQPFAAVCMLVRTEAVAVATASILTPEQQLASYAVTSTPDTRAVLDLLLLQAFFAGWQLNAQVTDHGTACAAFGQTCLQSCDVLILSMKKTWLIFT